jgi:hypothetical protein
VAAGPMIQGGRFLTGGQRIGRAAPVSTQAFISV